jgi:predicted permease
VDLGLNAANVVTFGLSPRLNAYTPERSRALFERLEEELAAVPGVSGATASPVPLFGGSIWGRGVDVDGFEEGPDTDDSADYNELGPGYFRILGSRLLAGREFTAADTAGAPKVAIVNEAFARKFHLGRNAVGKRMSSGGPAGIRDLDTEIVGLVQNTKYSEVKDPVPPIFYRPYRQNANLGFLTFYVRTALDPVQVLATIPKVVSRIDPDLPVENLRTLQEQIQENVFVDRIITVLSTGFAALATLLAAIGLYGVLAYTIAQRTRELGVRMALGASPGRVRAMVLKQVGVMTVIGGAIGLAAAVALGRAAQSMLFELQGHDPLALAGAVAALGLVAFGAGLIPAHRASQVDPIRALRYE